MPIISTSVATQSSLNVSISQCADRVKRSENSNKKTTFQAFTMFHQKRAALSFRGRRIFLFLICCLLINYFFNYGFTKKSNIGLVNQQLSPH